MGQATCSRPICAFEQHTADTRLFFQGTFGQACGGLAAGLLANEKTAQALAELHPLPRVGEPEDVAALARFLLSGEASWMTGQVIALDGGRSRVRPKG